MRIFIKISTVLISFFPLFLNAESCDFPNVDDCILVYPDKVYYLEDENISLRKSNLKIGSIFFSSEKFNISLYDSKLDLNRIIPSTSKYEINISLDKESSFTFRNANAINIESLNFADEKSIFNVIGFSSVSINNLTKNEGAYSVLKIDSGSSTVTLKNANLDDVYLLSGYLRIRESENGTTNIKNIFNKDPKAIEPEYEEPSKENPLNKGGKVEVLSKGTLNVGNINASQLNVVSGTANISGDFNIYTMSNYSASEDEEDAKEDYDAEAFINIGKNAKGLVNNVRVRDLNLAGEMTIENKGYITNLNSYKNEEGQYVGNAEGTLIFKGEQNPQTDDNGNLIDTATPTLSLRSVYLETLEIQNGEVSISSRNSVINNIKGDGVLKIEYLSGTATTYGMVSNNVQIKTLELSNRSKYLIKKDFDVDNLKMSSNSEITFYNSQNLTFETLEMGLGTKLLFGSEDNLDVADKTLDITVTKEAKIFNTMLNVNSFKFKGSDANEFGKLTIGVDNNLIKNGNSSFMYGINSTGNIDLENVVVVADIQNTSIFNLNTKYSYNVMHADGTINMNGENATTNLPDWFTSEFSVKEGENGEKGKNLVVEVTRDKSYEELLEGTSYAEDENTKNIAKSLDKMVENTSFTQSVSNVITNIDLKSDRQTIGQNLASLKPIDNNVYVYDIHSNATAYLDMLSQNSSYSYLKTKSEDSDILWVRNGFKKGKLFSKDYYDSNRNTMYFAMAGFDVFAKEMENSYFQLGVAGGFNFSDIKAKSRSYNISSMGYNVSLYSNYMAELYYVSLNLMFLHTNYDNTRYSVGDTEVTSSNNVMEFVGNIEAGLKVTLIEDISYQNAVFEILGLDNLLLRPSLFYTNGYIKGDSSYEEGNGGYHLGSYNTMAYDVGAGLLFYSTSEGASSDNDTLSGSYMPYFGVKSFYRKYDVPNTKIKFLNTSSTYDIDIDGDGYNGLVAQFSFGLDYEKDSYIIGIKYAYEHGFDSYNNNALFLNYKLLLN